MKTLSIMVLLMSLSFPAFARGNRAAEVPITPSEENILPEVINAYFFYEELCSLCRDDEERFIAILQDQLPFEERNRYPNNIQMVNIYEQFGRQFYLNITEEFGLDRELLHTPLLVLGGRVYQGYESISENIYEAYFTAAEDLHVNQRPYNHRTRKTGGNLFDDYPVNPEHVTMLYFYRIVCPGCIEVNPIIEALPKTVFANGRERPLDIIRINTRSGNNSERIAAFFEAWQVPNADRIVPIVFFSDSYLAGAEAIASEINQRVSASSGTWRLLPATQ